LFSILLASSFSEQIAKPAKRDVMNPLDLINLSPLMKRTRGNPEVVIALIDGPVTLNHPDLETKNIRALSEKAQHACDTTSSIACVHGTFVAGILSARRDTSAPAICPDCTLLVRPIFGETSQTHESLPSATPPELASAITECIDNGARVLNLSAALAQASLKHEQELNDALNYAAKRAVLVVVAAGNQGTVGSTAITRHPWVIPVCASDSKGQPMTLSNLGGSIARQGVSAPGENISSLSSDGKTVSFGGTSAATPFVTGTIALLWSAFPKATAADIKHAVTLRFAKRPATIVPPLLDAGAAYTFMLKNERR
jgi:subtilisin family serine protease